MAFFRPLVIKIGTNVITSPRGRLQRRVLKSLVSDLAALRRAGFPVMVVSSGAMGAGRGLLREQKFTDSVAERQTLAAVGQVELMRTYAALLRAHRLQPAQVLATREDFRDRAHYLNMRRCLGALLAVGLIPIINENDAVSVEELMFTDNDELAGLVASLMGAERLVILTSVPGILDATGQVIDEVNDVNDLSQVLTAEKSSFGRGGMATKGAVAWRLARLGITTHIMDGRQPGNLTKLLLTKAKVGTKFPAQASKPAIKRWLAEMRGQERGVATVNRGAADVLRDSARTASLLPVGITKITGEFSRGDIVQINDGSGKPVGYGRAEYGTAVLKKIIGRQHQKPFIHYNYLFVNSL
ncbi:MAG: glutamate 5-kinase [Candidatus Magasanikbacteria bacterium]|nr:glutamate 5-kinase [Candidatus Magasanikbacteria bacterium]